MLLRTLIEKHLQTHDTINIIIAGQSCSGKTTMANEIKEMFDRDCAVTIVSQDDYFKDVWDIPRSYSGYILLDSIEAFHVAEFKQDVDTLFRDGVVEMPRYEISTNTRISKDKCVKLGKINVFEGLHAISILGSLENSIKIFLNTSTSVCKNRRIQRDVQNQGIPERTIIEFWENSIAPMSKKYVFPQNKLADLVMYC